MEAEATKARRMFCLHVPEVRCDWYPAVCRHRPLWREPHGLAARSHWRQAALVFFKRSGQRTHRLLGSRVVPSPIPTATVNSTTRLPSSFNSDWTRRSSSPSKATFRCGGAKLPIHEEVIHQIVPSVTGADESATHAGKAGAGRAAIGRHGQRPFFFQAIRTYDGNVDGARRVASPPTSRCGASSA